MLAWSKDSCRLAPSRSFFLCIYSYLNKIALKSSAKNNLSKIASEIAHERSGEIHFCERAREEKQMTLAEEWLGTILRHFVSHARARPPFPYPAVSCESNERLGASIGFLLRWNI